MNQSINKSVNQSISQEVNQSVNQSRLSYMYVCMGYQLSRT